MTMLRAGLIGLGMMGRHHARVLRSVDGVELVAVADPNGDPHGVAGDLPLVRGKCLYSKLQAIHPLTVLPVVRHIERSPFVAIF